MYVLPKQFSLVQKPPMVLYFPPKNYTISLTCHSSTLPAASLLAQPECPLIQVVFTFKYSMFLGITPRVPVHSSMMHPPLPDVTSGSIVSSQSQIFSMPWEFPCFLFKCQLELITLSTELRRNYSLPSLWYLATYSLKYSYLWICHFLVYIVNSLQAGC